MDEKWVMNVQRVRSQTKWRVSLSIAYFFASITAWLILIAICPQLTRVLMTTMPMRKPL